MGDVIQTSFNRKQTDGGKARHYRRRDNLKFRLGLSESITRNADDLTMDHADPMDYMPSEYVAPAWDPA
ncbi:hypothetical protein [Bradyrhizobium lablabi]|uniref:hypothetical protein n=1 Tax=Bradyrhizobium lablabi TaxID=722472 RepID=UPI0009A681BD|nr:hypothetical protein [Bradyrhizobium lablabi]